MPIIGNSILLGSNGGGSISKPTYLISNGDFVSKFYFNKDYNLDSYLANLTYDQTMFFMGYDLNWCYIGFDYLCAVDLSPLITSGTYLLFWGESGYDPIYSTKEFDLSAYGFVKVSKGWNVKSIAPSSGVTIDMGVVESGFVDIMNYVVAKSSIAFGGYVGDKIYNVTVNNDAGKSVSVYWIQDGEFRSEILGDGGSCYPKCSAVYFPGEPSLSITSGSGTIELMVEAFASSVSAKCFVPSENSSIKIQ